MGAPPRNRAKCWSKGGRVDSGRVAACPPTPCSVSPILEIRSAVRGNIWDTIPGGKQS